MSGLSLPAPTSWVLGRGVHRSPAWSSLNHSRHAGLIQLGTERRFPLLATLTGGSASLGSLPRLWAASGQKHLLPLGWGGE